MPESDRLLFRPFEAVDAQSMFEMDADPEVARYVGNKPLTELKQSAEIIKFVQQQYLDNGIGRWVILEKKSNEFVGWAGLKLVKEEINGRTDFYDLGYRMKKKFWGYGYATEAAKYWVSYAFGNMKLKELIGMAHVENRASVNVLTKCGFKQEEFFNYDGDRHVWMRLVNSAM